MIRLIVIEDHPIILDGLRNRFRASRDEISIVEHAITVENAIEAVKPDQFDIILLDLWINKTDPYQNMSLLNAAFPGKPIVIYSMEESSYWIRTMIDLGAKAFLNKSVDRQEMKETIEAVMNGKTISPPVLSTKGAVENSSRDKYWLKPNEREIVTLLSKGMSLQEISERKHLTVSAIEKTMRKIRKQIGAKSSSEMIKILVNNKEIQ